MPTLAAPRIRTSHQHTTYVHQNLRWTRAGTVWADYVVEGIDYIQLSNDDKEIAAHQHKQLIHRLPQYSLLLGLKVPRNLKSIVRAQVHGIDYRNHPGWAEEVNAATERLDTPLYRPYTRLYYLSIPLDSKFRTGGAVGIGDAVDSIRTQLGAERATAPTPQEIADAVDKAQKLTRDMPRAFELSPATPFHIRWMWNHFLTRGTSLTPGPETGMFRDLPPGPSRFTQAFLDEGALEDSAHRALPSFDRCIKITQPGSGEVSYQKLFTIDTLPVDMARPGCEFLQLADYCSGDVDWALRVSRRSRTEVLAGNVKVLKTLNDQLDQRDSETSFAANGIHSRGQMLSDWNTYIEEHEGEFESQFTTIFAVGGRTRDDVEALGNELKDRYNQAGILLDAPLGTQRDLWAAMVPGTPPSRVVTESAQITSSDQFAAIVPFTRTTLGDAAGGVIAMNLTGGPIDVVHYDLRGKTLRDFSAATAVTGELGSGKSFYIKSQLGDVGDMGGQWLAIDNTDKREYVGLAETFVHPDGTPDHLIVDLARPQVSVDPLRMFADQAEAADRALNLLLPMMKLQPEDRAAGQLSDLVDPGYRNEHEIHSLPDLVDHLEGTGRDPFDLLHLLNFWRKRRFTAALFDRDLPPMNFDATAIVVATQGLRLPTEVQVTNEHLYRDLDPDQRFAHHIYNLVAVLAKTAFFRSPRFCVFCTDEAYQLTNSPVGQSALGDFIFDGRKNDAALIMGSQEPQENFPGAELIPTKLAFRQRSEPLAKRSLRWLGINPDEDPAAVTRLRFQTSPPTGKDDYVDPLRRGEAFMRDSAGRIGFVKILGPARAARFAALNTTPGKQVS